MSDPFLGEIIMFGGNFAPRGWSFCDGNLLPIAQNTALFSILGTNYGGDGRTTFGLPELRGRVAMHAGNGPGLSSRRLGQSGGTETNTMTTAQMPAHKHTFNAPCNSDDADQDEPTNNFPGTTANNLYSSTKDDTMGAGDTASAGGGQPVNNLQPYQVVNFIIALVGTFPSRS